MSASRQGLLASAAARDGALVALGLLPIALFATRRDLDGLDGPEFALVARTWGLAHPPGQPLHTLVAGALGAWRPSYFRVALASTLPLCLAAVPLALLAERLAPLGTNRPARLARALAIAAALAFAPVFETGTRVEVYALAALGMFCSLAAAAHRRPFVAGLCASLALCAHLSFGLVAGFAALIALCGARDAPIAATVARFAAGGVLGLAPYAWLPFASRDASRFAWGEPDTVARFVDVVTFKAYRGNLRASSSHFARSFAALAPLLVPSIASLVAAVASLASWKPRPWSLGAALLVVSSAHVAQVAINVPFAGNPDLRGYLVPVALVAAVVLSARAASWATTPARAWAAVGAAALALALALASSGAWLRSSGALPSAQRLLVDAALRDAPANAIVLLDSDTLGFGALYAQEAEGYRRDLVLVPGSMLLDGWYRRHLRARHAGLRMPSGRFRGGAEYHRAFALANAERPVVAETRARLIELGIPSCIGPFLARASAHCGAFSSDETRARLAAVRAAARAASSDWIQQRLVASEAWRLARDDQAEGSLGRALATMAAALDVDPPMDPTRAGPVCFPLLRAPDLHVPPWYLARAVRENLVAQGLSPGPFSALAAGAPADSTGRCAYPAGAR